MTKATQGIQGVAGVKGDKGDKGDQGIQGIQGVAGAKGDKGDKGTDQGIQGVAGVKGDRGATGPVGPSGLDGAPGAKGQDGADGTNGKSAYDIWVDLGNTGTEQDFIDSLKPTQDYIDLLESKINEITSSPDYISNTTPTFIKQYKSESTNISKQYDLKTDSKGNIFTLIKSNGSGSIDGISLQDGYKIL